MSSACAGPINDLAALLAYPRPGLRRTLEEARARLAEASPAAAEALDAFAQFVAGKTDPELEEAFTQTFDLNPACALEIGWHLYGEDYKRGEFLVEMRGLMRRLGVPEDAELPDHLAHVLAVLGRLDEAAARALAEEKILPALAKMRKAAAGHPYDGVLRAIEIHLGGKA